MADQGCGMTAQQAARMLEPFAQAEAATARRYGDTGLGLAIERQLVDRMGGRLDL